MKFYILCGLPGTGKTTTAKRLYRETGAVIISSDDIRRMLTGGVYPSGSQYDQIDPLVWQLAETMVKIALRAKRDVVLDTTALTHELRRNWRKVAWGAVGRFDVEIITLWHDGEYDSPERWQEERGISVEEHARIMAKLRAKAEMPEDGEL